MFRLLIIWFCKNFLKETRKGLFFCEGLARLGTRKVRDSLRDSQGLADFFSHKKSQKISKNLKKIVQIYYYLLKKGKLTGMTTFSAII